MNKKRNFANILAACIDEIIVGKSTVEDCLTRYPDLRDELEPLLEMASRIQPPQVAPSPEFRIKSKARLSEVMASSRVKRHSLSGWFKPLTAPIRFSAAILTIIITLALASSGTTVYAAQKSLPDDVFYPLKRNIEKFQLSITLDSVSRANAHLKLAEKRVEEMLAQLRLQRRISVSTADEVARELDAAIREISRVPSQEREKFFTRFAEANIEQQLKLGEATAPKIFTDKSVLNQAVAAVRQGNLISEVAYSNPSFLNLSPSVAQGQLQRSYFKLKGTLIGIEGADWNVGGLLLKNVSSPLGRPPAGSRIEIRGITLSDEIYISQLKIKEKDGEKQIEVKGVFTGTNGDGTVWSVSGIPVSVPVSTRPPSVGSQIELTGTVQAGSLVLGELTDERYDTEEVEIRGIILAVDVQQKNIVMEVPPARIQTDVSQAEIKTRDGSKLGLVSLLSFLGEDIRIEGTYSKDKGLSAKKVIIEVGLDKDARDEKDEESAEEMESDSSQEERQDDIDSGRDTSDNDSDSDSDTKSELEEEQSDSDGIDKFKKPPEETESDDSLSDDEEQHEEHAEHEDDEEGED